MPYLCTVIQTKNKMKKEGLKNISAGTVEHIDGDLIRLL